MKVHATLNGDAVKLPGMTVKLTENGNDENYFFESRSEVPVDGYVFRFDNAKLAGGTDAAKLKLVFDFSGAEEGTVVVIDEITLIRK